MLSLCSPCCETIFLFSRTQGRPSSLHASRSPVGGMFLGVPRDESYHHERSIRRSAVHASCFWRVRPWVHGDSPNLIISGSPFEPRRSNPRQSLDGAYRSKETHRSCHFCFWSATRSCLVNLVLVRGYPHQQMSLEILVCYSSPLIKFTRGSTRLGGRPIFPICKSLATILMAASFGYYSINRDRPIRETRRM
ncbi:hypothetical protein J3A83DRAFT_1652980 [Scleroderma citrinum]